jgi:hypothetical protein
MDRLGFGEEATRFKLRMEVEYACLMAMLMMMMNGNSL